MLTPEQVAQFKRDGFLNGGRVLTESELTDLTGALDRVIQKGPKGFAPDEPHPVLFRNLVGETYDGKTREGAAATPVWQIVNIWEAAPAFHRLMFHPFVVDAISQLSGFGDLQVWHDQVQYKPAAIGGSTAWHQDAPLWPSIEPMTPVTAWIPFDDADEANGCMWMVPGSHQWGNQMQYLGGLGGVKTLPEFGQIGKDFSVPVEAQQRDVRAVPCPVRRGEVHFHHSLTWHGSPENRSPRPRRAIAIHYMTSEARYTGKGHPMQPFINVDVGGRMLEAGPHFPVVCRGAKPVPAPV